jgi:hypothetical protein
MTLRDLSSYADYFVKFHCIHSASLFARLLMRLFFDVGNIDVRCFILIGVHKTHINLFYAGISSDNTYNYVILQHKYSIY